MWALRRAANPLRSQATRMITTRILGGSVGREGGGRVLAACNSLKPRPCGSAASARSFSWSRNLSSRAGAKSSDSEDELEDGFSDLETPAEGGKAEVVEGKDAEVASEGDASELDLDEGAETVLSGDESEVSDEKKKARSGEAYELFNILMDTNRNAIHRSLDKWLSDGKSLERSEIYYVMQKLRQRRIYGKALQVYEWLEEKKHIEFTERDYASYLDLTAKVLGLYKAERYIAKVPKSFQGEVVYRTLLANCVSIGNIKKAEDVFNKIKELGFPLSTFVFNQLLLLYKRHDRKKIADVLNLMEKENVKPTAFTFRLLIDVKGRANDISGMEELVELMKAEGIEPDMIIHAMLTKFYIYANLKEKAEAELKEIEGEDITQNRNAVREVLPLYASLGKAGDVQRIWKVCEANPRLEECVAAIEAWGRLGKVEKAEEVFELMKTNWKKLSARYYNAMLKVYASHNQLLKGKELAKRMSEDGCRIGALTWDALVKLYVTAGEVEKADSLLHKAEQQSQTKLLYSSYLSVLDQYAKRGDVHNAEKIFNKVRMNGYRNRLKIYQSLLQAYVNSKTPAYGFRERLKADDIFPNKSVAAQLREVDGFKKTQILDLLD